MIYILLYLLPWVLGFFTPEPYGRLVSVGMWGGICGFVALIPLPVLFFEEHEDRWFVVLLVCYFLLLYWFLGK